MKSKVFFAGVLAVIITAPLMGQCKDINSRSMAEETAFNQFTLDEDRLQGEYASLGFETMLRQGGKSARRIYDKAITDQLVEISRRILALAPESARSFKFSIGLVDDSEPNAFQLGGGVILVTLGEIAEAPSEDFVAMVLAHEFCHTIRRHRTAFLTRLKLAVTARAVDARLAALHDEFEQEADIFGSRLAVAAGYNPGSVIARFREKKSKNWQLRATIFECAAAGKSLEPEAMSFDFFAIREHARKLLAAKGSGK
ncbi:MAG TPA: M48 family metallopeptidase [Thermoanaerobaculia bacterium]|nr:M48 family metallopeptidase [Thermoanaerobaculia bacterium]